VATEEFHFEQITSLAESFTHTHGHTYSCINMFRVWITTNWMCTLHITGF